MSNFEKLHRHTKHVAREAFEQAQDGKQLPTAAQKKQVEQQARLEAERTIANDDLRRMRPAPALTPNNPALKRTVHEQVRQLQHAGKYKQAGALIKERMADLMKEERQASERSRAPDRGRSM